MDCWSVVAPASTFGDTNLWCHPRQAQRSACLTRRRSELRAPAPSAPAIPTSGLFDADPSALAAWFTKEKGPPKKAFQISSLFWLPDLGSNQGPTTTSRPTPDSVNPRANFERTQETAAMIRACKGNGTLTSARPSSSATSFQATSRSASISAASLWRASANAVST